MQKAILVILIMISTLTIYGQQDYFNGIVTLIDDTQLQGQTEAPDHLNDKIIKFKPLGTSVPKIIPSDSIKSLDIIINDQIRHHFIYTRHQLFNQKKGTIKTTKKNQWLVKDYATPKLVVYTSAQKYGIDENGKLKVTSTYVLKFFVCKPNEIFPFKVHEYDEVSENNTYFINSLAHYLNDTPALAKKIKKGAFTWDRLYEVAEAYNWYLENQK